MKPKAAIFTLVDFKFTTVLIESRNYDDSEMEVDFLPTGKFHENEIVFELVLSFKAFTTVNGIDKPFVKTEMVALFSFAEEIQKIEDIPVYFYSNSLAIIYPYIRSFVSSVTLQANLKPIVLPTMNLKELETPLKENTSKV